MGRKYRTGIFCVVYSVKPLRYLLLHRKLHWKGWEFTKGGSRAGEKPEKTVKRELKEETGLKQIAIKKFPNRGSFAYDKKAQADWKAEGFRYVLFACEVKNGKVKIDKKEHDKYRWCSYKETLALLKWPNQKSCLKIVHKSLNVK